MRRHSPIVTTGRAVSSASVSPGVKDPTILFDEKSTSNVSRPFAAGDDEILVIRACLPPGVMLSVETGRIPTGHMPSGDSCRGVICVPYDTSMTDVCPLTVCCTAQSMSSCGNLVALPPLPGFIRLVLAPLSAVGTVKVFAETINYAAASFLPDRYWLGECPVVAPPPPPAPSTDLMVTKTISAATFNVGDTGTMNLTATNNGPTADPAALIRDDLSTGLGVFMTFPGTFAITYTGGATGPAVVNPALLMAGVAVNMPVGSTAVIVIPFTAASATAGNTNTNTARINTSLPGGDTVSGNNVSTVTVTIIPVGPQQVDLFITKRFVGPTPLYTKGTVGTFHVTAGNNGPAAAVNAVLTDRVPFSNSSIVIDPVFITYGGGATGPASTTYADLAAGIILPLLPVGGTVDFDARMRFYGTNTQQNIAAIAASPPQIDSDTSNNSATARVTALFPPLMQTDLSVVKTINSNTFDL